MVNEPSVFEPSRFDCSIILTHITHTHNVVNKRYACGKFCDNHVLCINKCNVHIGDAEQDNTLDINKVLLKPLSLFCKNLDAFLPALK